MNRIAAVIASIRKPTAPEGRISRSLPPREPGTRNQPVQLWLGLTLTVGILASIGFRANSFDLPIQAPGVSGLGRVGGDNHLSMVFPLVETPQGSEEIFTLPADEFHTTSFFLQLEGDVTQAGVGLRGTGSGDLVLAGIPDGASVVKAFLYWATIGMDGTFVSPTLNRAQVDGTRIGTSADTCWGAQNNYVYRSDVTPLVDGNGTYRIADLPHDGPSSNDSQGASLVVVYKAAGMPHRTLAINDGAVTLDFNRFVYTDTLRGLPQDEFMTGARLSYIVGDGQAIFFDGDVTVNGTVIASNVFSGTLGDYWDILSADLPDLAPAVALATSISSFNVPADDTDCLLWAATIFSVTSIRLEEHSYLPVMRR